MKPDNYFAKFLHRNTVSKDPSSVSSQSARNVCIASFPSNSTSTLAVDAPCTMRNTPNVHQIKHGSAGAALWTHNSPTNAAETENISTHTAVSVASTTPSRTANSVSALSPLESTEEEYFQPAKINRCENGNKLRSCGINSLSSRKNVKVVSARSVGGVRSYSDDEDELDLLLGKKKAQEVKQVDALMSNIQLASPTSCQEMCTDRSHAEANLSTTCSIGSLLWSTRSNSIVREYIEYFKRQFEYELQSNRPLFDSFEPFFRDKVLERIESGARLSPVFTKGPTVCTADVAALPGYSLRDYQLAGVQFLLDNFHRGMSCILSDDMGLGKTAQIASFLHVLKMIHTIDGPHLIVAPLSTLTNWTKELARWAPGLKVMKYHGERRARERDRMSHHNRHAVTVTTPAILNQDRGFFRKRSWVTIIIDEAHVLKGCDTQITTTARKLNACFRIAVTGTPVHNNVREVWSLMGFLYPSFMAGYDNSIRRDDENAMQAAKDSANLLTHVMLRRTKETLELGIPPRVDEPVTLLEPTYIQLQLLDQMTARVLEGGENARQLQLHFSHQRAVCNHPMTLRLLASEGRGQIQSGTGGVKKLFKLAGIPLTEAALICPSAKMMFLDGLLKRLRNEGHRCLIFSNFTSTLDLLEGFCLLREYSYERLDGNCNRVERELSMLRYNAPNSSCFLFLATTTAGGVGVTLTGADTVILFDMHFNPQLDRQAADRAHRIGQTRVVHVYRLCLRNTVEEHIHEIAQRKASLGDYIVDGARREGDTAGLATEDIQQILKHLNRIREGRREVRAIALAIDSNSGNGKAPQNCAISEISTCDENKMVDELIRVERDGLHCGFDKQPVAHNSMVSNSKPLLTHHCFVCGRIMHPLEPLYHCTTCPKAYHAECIGMKKRNSWETAKQQWSCPRHACSLCGKTQRADGAIFMCVNCPEAFCFDCLDPRYLAMNENGSQLLHIQRTYEGMEEEGIAPNRSCYYISCLHCSGLASLSSSTDEDDDDDDNDDDDIPSSDVEGGLDS